MHKRYLSLILVLVCLVAATFNACGALPVSTTEAETTTVTTTSETTTEETTTTAPTTTQATTTRATTTTSKKTQEQSTIPSTTAALPEVVLLPFDDKGALIWNASDITDVSVEYIQERTKSYALYADLSSKNIQTLIVSLNRMSKTLVGTEVRRMYDLEPPFADMNLKRSGENELYSLRMDRSGSITLSVYRTTDCGYLMFRRRSDNDENTWFFHHSLYRISLGDVRRLERLFEGLEKHQEFLKDKPVIYLYPTRPTKVEVLLETHGDRLTETIPPYNTGWHVLAQPNGALTNLADGKTYPYLFWESIGPSVVEDITEGFLVTRKDLEPFFREKLAYMGLIPVEYEEFIDYWLPILKQNEYSLIYFAGEEYTERYPLEITPTPDSLLRVFMVAKATDGSEKLPRQELKPFKREGFAVIEWGGTILN